MDKGTILVVDDSPASLKLRLEVLTAAGYQALPADSGELALAAVAANPPELICSTSICRAWTALRFVGNSGGARESGHSDHLHQRVRGKCGAGGGLRLGAVDFITSRSSARNCWLGSGSTWNCDAAGPTRTPGRRPAAAERTTPGRADRARSGGTSVARQERRIGSGPGQCEVAQRPVADLFELQANPR